MYSLFNPGRGEWIILDIFIPRTTPLRIHRRFAEVLMMIKHRLEACSLSRMITPWTSKVDGIVLDLTGLASRILNNTGSVPAVQALLWIQVVVEDVVEVETWARNRAIDFSGTC